ncbi:MAG: SDR family NAD(P)-dependent oxidoreductase [Faecalicoccus sp.]|uniref:SDR family NAD(P)-dependent oxidoreductase n=1 Tax=unclassified Faecalicoccus TaxID=2643311 RepID=UPI0025D91501|nr:SDR family NAD(P)-dependent oxidoreductase [Faecalicoccus sp.]MCI6378821.1 SDR family oxidoreductase [Erysipelotrichaceae bacterium]MDY4869939.1 SDR family NAD(P)-dependent oxidoreductase [Faecalicoccus sp.]MDY5111195.1 SDR family NAD(P)-dependent oxidoreductase [Faecalicoccus sp.]
MFDFTNQVVIVTGSGSPKGIGKTIAKSFVEQGASVVIADVNSQGIENTVREIKEMGGDALGVTFDVTSKESCESLVDQVMHKYGRIDVLVNNAGISQKVTVAEMTVEDYQRILNVNVIGLFLVTQAVMKVMRKAKYGRIVNLSSVSGKRGGGVFGGAHYSASKAAVLAFSKNLSREISNEGITINSVCPGLINTEIWKSLPSEDAKKVIDGIPMGRPGETKEVAAAIVFLASKEASYITGEEIDINGGSHMD